MRDCTRGTDVTIASKPVSVDYTCPYCDEEVSEPLKYSLKVKTCAGIMDRARRKGRSLPPQLYAALANATRSPSASKEI